jgi:hypothetical protein
MQKLLAALVAVPAMLATPIPALADDPFSLGVGLDYTSGKYGNTTSTSIVEVPVVGRYESDNVTLMLTVPYISVTGPGGVIPGIGRVGQGYGYGNAPNNTRTTTTTSSGLGDVIASAGYTVHSSDALALDVFGNVKFGTADAAKGLGTGENDYSAQVDGYYTLAQTTMFATAGYKVYGSTAAIPLDNAPYGAIGISQGLGDKTSAGARLDIEKSPSVFEEDQRYMTVFVSQEVSNKTYVSAHLMKGFTNSTADYGFGAMITGYF